MAKAFFDGSLEHSLVVDSMLGKVKLSYNGVRRADTLDVFVRYNKKLLCVFEFSAIPSSAEVAELKGDDFEWYMYKKLKKRLQHATVETALRQAQEKDALEAALHAMSANCTQELVFDDLPEGYKSRFKPIWESWQLLNNNAWNEMVLAMKLATVFLPKQREGWLKKEVLEWDDDMLTMIKAYTTPLLEKGATVEKLNEVDGSTCYIGVVDDVFSSEMCYNVAVKEGDCPSIDLKVPHHLLRKQHSLMESENALQRKAAPATVSTGLDMMRNSGDSGKKRKFQGAKEGAVDDGKKKQKKGENTQTMINMVKYDTPGRETVPITSEGLPFFKGRAPEGHSQPWVYVESLEEILMNLGDDVKRFNELMN